MSSPLHLLAPTIPADVDSSTVSIPLGITIGLLASFIQSLGLTIQRKSHVQNQALPEEQRKVEHRRPLWLLGFAIFISSNLFGSIVQIASLPVVILAPLGAVSLLWNAFFARMLLGDAFSVWMLLGTILIAGGAVLIAVFGIVPEPTHSLEDLLILFGRPAFVVYFSLLGFVVVVCLAITHGLEYSYSRRIALPTTTPPLSPLLAPATAPTILTTAATPNSTIDPPTPAVTERTPLIDRKASRPATPSDSGSQESSNYRATLSDRLPTLLAMSYASFSGILSGMCLLFAKSGVELLVLTIAGKNQFWRWQAWVLVLGLVVCALLQLWYMHKGLVLANPTLICPLAFCFYNISSIVNGLVYFDQFSLLSATHLCLVMLGMVVLLAGVWIVSLPPSGGVGVDIPGWDEQRESSAAMNEETTVGEVYEDEPLPMVRRRTSHVEPTTPHDVTYPTAGLGIIIEDGANRYGSLSRRQTLPSSHTRGQTDTALISPTASTLGPPIHRTTSPEDLRGPRPRALSTLPPSTSLSSQHTLPQRQSSQFGYPFPLSPGGTPGTLGGGFTIGLSPISPGFALVPRQKRRRTGSTGEGLSPVTDDSYRSNGRLRDSTSMRRVVSDGGVHSPLQPSDSSDSGERGWLLGSDEEAAGGSTAPASSAKGGRAKARWRWLKGILPFVRNQ